MSLDREDDYEPKFWSKTSLIQIGYGIWVNQVLVLLGMAFGFTAVALPQLAAIGPSLPPFKMNLGHEGWIASTLSLSSPIGCIVSGCLMDKIGRRALMIICVIPMAVGWLLTGFSKNSVEMIIGRIITGVGAGMATAPPRAYCTEISLPKMRGVLGTFPTIALALGITIQAVMGSVFEWKSLCYICGGYSIFLMFFNWFLPETPYFVLVNGPTLTAKDKLMKFRARNHKIEQEFDEMRIFKRVHHIHRLSLKETITLTLSAAACKPFAVIMGYIIIGQLAGVTVVMFFTVDILQESKISINPFTGNIMLGLSRLVGGIIASVLIFKMRRKPLALISGGVGLTCLVLGFYIKFTSEPSLIPQIGYVIYTIFSTLGFLTLPLLMLFELLPMQIRGLLGGITVSLWHITVFAANVSFLYVKRALGYPQTMIGFGMFALIGFVFIFFFLPETKGLSLTEIEETFTYKRRNSTSENLETPQPLELKKEISVIRHKQAMEMFKVDRANLLDTEADKLAALHIESDHLTDDHLQPRKSSVTFLVNDDNNETSKQTKDTSDNVESK